MELRNLKLIRKFESCLSFKKSEEWHFVANKQLAKMPLFKKSQVVNKYLTLEESRKNLGIKLCKSLGTLLMILKVLNRVMIELSKLLHIFQIF